ncbi:MAG: PAS domain S-box protein [Candidatus Pacearchaeota archaeon]|jgi:PAS domain S-box-containing protein
MEEIDYKAIIDSTYDCEIVRDKNLNLIYVSPSFERIFGYKNIDYLSGKIKTETIIYKEDIDKINKYFELLKKFGTIEDSEIRGITKDNKIIWLSLSCQPIKDSKENNIGMRCSLREITKRKINEENLKISLEKLALSQKASNSGAWDWDMISNKLSWTDEFYNLFGINRKDYPESFETWKNLLHPEDKERTIKILNESIINKTHLKNYYRIIKPNKEIIWIEALGNTYYKDNKAIRMSGICIDITEKKNIEEKLKESEERFKILSESSINGIYLTDPKGDCIYANPAWLEMAGIKFNEALGKGWINALHPEDKKTISENWYKTVESNGKWAFEYRFITPSGKIHWIYGRAKAIFDLNNQLIGFIGNNTDITEKKRIELELKEEKEKFKKIFETSPLVLGLSTIEDGKYIEVNEKFLEVFDLKKEEVIGKTSKELNIFSNYEDRNKIIESLKEKNIEKGIEIKINTKKGPVLYQFYISKTFYQEKEHLLVIGQDINDKKEFETKIKESENFLNQIIENLPLMIFVKDAKELRFEILNKKGEEIFGQKSENIIGKNDYDFFPKDQAEFFIKKDMETINSKNLIDIPEEPIKSPMGERILHTKKIPLFDENNVPNHLLGISEDITEKINLNKQIIESEQKFKSLYYSMNEGVALHELVFDDKNNPIDYIILDVNPKFEEITNIKREDIINKKSIEIYKTKEPPYFNVYKDVSLNGKSTNFESYFEPMKKHFSISAFSPSKNKFATIFTDITEKIEKEKRYLELFNNINDAVFIHDLDGYFLEANEVSIKRLGYSKEELLKMNLKNIDLPIFQEKIKERVNNLVNNGSNIFESVHVTKSGKEIPVEINTKIIDYLGKKAILSISRDISERKKNEDILKKSSQEWETTFNSMQDLISIHDKDYRIIKVNKAFADAFNLKPEEIIGMKCYELVHSKTSPLPFCPHKKAMEEGSPQKLEYYDEHLKLYLEVGTNPIYNENKEFIGTVHVVRNISERKNIEKEIIMKSQELEKFNQFAVGREMKMIELKKEINNLLNKLNEKPKYEV